jgi:hypothetical protein
VNIRSGLAVGLNNVQVVNAPQSSCRFEQQLLISCPSRLRSHGGFITAAPGLGHTRPAVRKLET